MKTYKEFKKKLDAFTTEVTKIDTPYRCVSVDPTNGGLVIAEDLGEFSPEEALKLGEWLVEFYGDKEI